VRVLLDTSLLVGAMVEAHPYHEFAHAWLRRAVHREVEGVVAAHTLAEFYAVLTRMPVRPRITAEVAEQLIRHNVLPHLEVVSLGAKDYLETIQHAAVSGITGGTIYDALIFRVAVKAATDRVLTLNVRDFRRIHPELADMVVGPDQTL